MGPTWIKKMVVFQIINQALNNEDITIYGKDQTRSFCYIEDLINIILLIAFKKELIDKPLNIGNNREFSIMDIAKIIYKKINPKSKII